MKTIQTVLLFFLLPVAISQGGSTKATLYIPEGQLLSKPVTVYVANTNITKESQPTLQLVSLGTSTKPDANGQYSSELLDAAPGQDWTEVVGGKNVQREGTMLIFSVKAEGVSWYKAAVRLNPKLSWNSEQTNQSPIVTALYSRSVYLGRIWPATLWTFIFVGALVAFIWVCSVRTKHRAIYLICGDDGYLSLWRTQLIAWTLAVGSLVFCYGLIRSEVPQIPETLVALMGMSVATGGLSSMAATSQWAALQRAGHKPKHNPAPPRLSDLISSYNPTFQEAELSVPKAQMVFWTGIMLALFIVKSLLIGGLWEVPWEMVALTGVSQAGYVSDKASKRHPAVESKPANSKTKEAGGSHGEP